MGLYEPLAELPLRVESCRLEPLKREVSGAFTRHTTVVHLIGGGAEGVGEDVTYEADDQLAFQRRGTDLPLPGSFTISTFSTLVDGAELFYEPRRNEASRFYRRWAFESAALDLALRQAGLSLAAALGIEPRPVRFVVSTSLGRPPSAEPVLRWLRLDPELRFKLDVTRAWDGELLRQLVETRAVDVVDFKGAYRGTPVDSPPDGPLYRRVAEAFPDAWLEDPALNDETKAALAGHEERITWDAPIHAVADLEALALRPRMLNVKPSRFGTLQALFHAYDHCAEQGIRAYGGGQFELGPGRGQIQYLAALFHPDAPNDVAPRAYNAPVPSRELPRSPLAPRLSEAGFRWE